MAGALFYNDNGVLIPLSIGYQGPQGVKGDTGATGPQGPKGDQGNPGMGIPAGGTTGQILGKNSLVDYDVRWIDPADIDLTSVSYLFGGNDTSVDPGPGYMAISEISGDNRRLAFDGFDADGFARNFAIMQVGDTIVITDTTDPAETIFARYLVSKVPFDMGGWFTIDVLRTDTVGSITPPAIGTDLTVTATFSAGGGGGGSDGYTYVTEDAPVGDDLAPLKTGQTWYQTSTGDSFVWVDDGTSAQWIQTAPGGGGGGAGHVVANLTQPNAGGPFPSAAWQVIPGLTHTFFAKPGILYKISYASAMKSLHGAVTNAYLGVYMNAIQKQVTGGSLGPNPTVEATAFWNGWLYYVGTGENITLEVRAFWGEGANHTTPNNNLDPGQLLIEELSSGSHESAGEWVPLVGINGWTVYGSCRLNGDKIEVHWYGGLRGGTFNQAAAMLPVGMRPTTETTQVVATEQPQGLTTVQYKANGEIMPITYFVGQQANYVYPADITLFVS